MDLVKYLNQNYSKIFRKPFGDFRFPLFLPIDIYASQLWDWGSYFSDVAIRQIATNLGKEKELAPYEKGCVLNFLDHQKADGSIPISIAKDKKHDLMTSYPLAKNIHKPVLIQHVAFIYQYNKDKEWIKPIYNKLKKFISFYENHAKHETGLFFFFDDFAIGVDNEVSCFYRPDNSCASIYLNSLMYKELEALAFLAKVLNKKTDINIYKKKAERLKKAINDYCYDEKDGMYYSCDINLRKIDTKKTPLHQNAPRHYSTLIMRLGSWTSFMPLWAGIPNRHQAKRIVNENLLKDAFWANYGIRTLANYEKMYRPNLATSNPSNWHGGVWGISNYLVYRGLINYGYSKEASVLAKNTIKLFETDYKKNQCLHEYYNPDTGKGIHDPGFLSWNMLVMNIIANEKHLPLVKEF